MNDNTFKTIQFKAFIGRMSFNDDGELIYFLIKELLESICMQENYREILSDVIKFIQGFEESERPDYANKVWQKILNTSEKQ